MNTLTVTPLFQWVYKDLKFLGTYLNTIGGKKIVYVSASRSPPFIPRYLSTKVEAEEFLLSQPNLGSIILKPGFIYSYSNRKWSASLKYAVDAWHCGFGIVYDKVIPKNTMMNNITG